jgi:hypothetical protein
MARLAKCQLSVCVLEQRAPAFSLVEFGPTRPPCRDNLSLIGKLSDAIAGATLGTPELIRNHKLGSLALFAFQGP